MNGKPTPVPTLSAAYWMGADPSLLQPAFERTHEVDDPSLEVDHRHHLESSSSLSGEGDFEMMWSSTPFVSGDDDGSFDSVDEWDAYLQNVSQMVRELQSELEP